MRVLICGGRDWNDYEFLRRYLDNFFYKRELIHADCTIIEGDARGADRQAGQWVQKHSYNMKLEKYPANWSLGKVAGYLRNKQMLEEGKPDIVIAFPGGRGTSMMIDLAKKAGVPVEIVSYP